VFAASVMHECSPARTNSAAHAQVAEVETHLPSINSDFVMNDDSTQDGARHSKVMEDSHIQIGMY